MSPQEKAIKIVDTFIQTLGNSFHAKECALLAVQEAEKAEYNVLTKFGFVTKNYTSDYWQEVKSEIERF